MNQLLSVSREQGFELLVELVRENHRTGRRSYGASLKPQLKRQTNGAFDEVKMGFPSFGAFLEAAAKNGLVELHKAPQGPDSQAVLPGEQPLWDRAERAQSTRRRVRHDLWTCFADWRAHMLRLYDRSTGVASMVPRRPSRNEASSIRDIRASYDARPSDFVEITPASMDIQLGWMRAFSATLDDGDMRSRLLTALDAERPAREFAQAVNDEPEIARRWRELRERHVVSEIEAWAAENRLTIDPYGTPIQTLPAAEQHLADTGRLERLRGALHSAIDVMPESELLRISLPVEYLLLQQQA